MQSLGGSLTEQNVRCCNSLLVLLSRVDHRSHLLSQALLQYAQVGSLLVLGDQRLNGLAVEQREDTDVALSVVVAHVQPELVELVGRGVASVEPYVTALGLTELGAVSLLDQRAGDGVSLATELAADQLGTCGDVAPLVRTAQLHLATEGFVQVQEVVALQQLIGELGERHTVALAIEALLNRILGHHIVYGDHLTDVACEIEEGEVLHPVVVIHEQCCVGCVAIEIDQLRELSLDRLLIVAQGSLVKQVTLLRLAAGVANHTRSTTYQCDGAVTATLEVLQDHNAHQVTDMQRVSRGVDTQICSGHLLGQLLLSSGHNVVDHTTPFEFFYKIHFVCFVYHLFVLIPIPIRAPCAVCSPSGSSRPSTPFDPRREWASARDTQPRGARSPIRAYR